MVLIPKQSPQQIGKAIAPEIALAMEKQIELDEYSIAEVLGPQMGQAIKNQIKYERDAMVDALYPIIGNTILKYMADLVKSINDKLEKAVTFEGITRKIRAKMQGISEAELILKETIDYHVQAIFLIHKASGLVVATVQSQLDQTLDADMLSAMLTAIRSFANDCFTVSGQVSELQEIEYDNSKIILEVAGYCYLAIIVQGNPPQHFLQKLKNTMSKIILDYGSLIASFEGDPSTIPQTIEQQLEKLLESKAKVKKSKPPLTLLLFVLALIVPLGMIWYRHQVANRLEAEITKALDLTPELSIYRIIPQVDNGKIILTGRLPNQYLRKQAGEVVSAITPLLELDNQIIAVKVPPDPVLVAGEIKRVTELLNQTKGVTISSRYQQKNTVILEGSVPEASDRAKIIQAFKEIPGVEVVIFTVD